MRQEAIDRLNDLRRRCDELAQESGAMSEIECISNEIKNVVDLLERGDQKQMLADIAFYSEVLHG